MGSKEIDFSLLDNDIGLFELGATLSEALHLPPFKRNSGLEVIFDKIVMANLAIVGNGVG